MPPTPTNLQINGARDLILCASPWHRTKRFEIGHYLRGANLRGGELLEAGPRQVLVKVKPIGT
jgi:hypothetical protein